MSTKKKCGAKKAKSKKVAEGKFGCGFYKKLFISKSKLKRHVNAVHEKLKPFQCEQCSKSFSKNCNLELHREINHKSKIFKCIMCNSSFKKESLLKMHIERNH